MFSTCLAHFLLGMKLTARNLYTGAATFPLNILEHPEILAVAAESSYILISANVQQNILGILK